MTRWSPGRWLRASVAAGLIVLAVLAGAAHTPFGRALVWSWLREALSSYDIEARGRLDYNLLTLDLRIYDLALHLPGLAQTPFFSADLIHVRLSPRALVGRLASSSVEIDRPRVHLQRDSKGIANWPALPAGSQTNGSSSIELGTVRVRDLDVSFTDEQADQSLNVRSLSLHLPAPASQQFGTILLGSSSQWRSGERRITLNTLSGALRFDGTNLHVRDLLLETGTNRMRLDGSIGPLFDRPQIDVTGRGAVDLGFTSTWFRLPGEPAGTVAFEGSIRGPATQPYVSLSLTGDGLSWRGLRDLSLRAHAVWMGDAIDVSGLSIGLAGGEVTARARVTLIGDTRPGTAMVAWHRLPLAALQPAIAPGLPFSLGASVTGHVDARWSDSRVTALTLRLENRSQGVSGSGPLDLDGSLLIAISAGRWQARADGVVGRTLRIEGSSSGRASGEDPLRWPLTGVVKLTAPDLGAAWRAARTTFLVPDSVAHEASGDAVAELRLGGTIGVPHVRGTLHVEHLRYGSFGASSLVVRAAAAGDRLDVDSIEAQAAGNSLHGAGHVSFATQEIEARIEASLGDLSGLATGAPEWLGLAGSGTATADVRGTWSAPTLHLRAAGPSLEIAGQRVDQWSTDTRVDAEGVSVDTFVLSQESGELTGSGRYSVADGSYSLSLSGRSLDLRPIRRRDAAPPIPVQAAVDIEFEGSGTMADPRGRGRLSASNVEWSGRQIGGLDAQFSLETQSFHVTARATDEPVVANATFRIAPLGPFTATLDVAQFDFARFTARWLPGVSMSRGVLTSVVKATGDFTDLPSASLGVDLRQLDGVFADSATIRLAAPAQWGYANGQVDISATRLQLGDSVLELGGRMGPDPSQMLTAMLEGELRDLAVLLPIIASSTRMPIGPLEAAGTVKATLTARNALREAVVNGEFAVRDGRVRLGDAPPASDIRLAAAYRDGTLDLHELTATWQGARLSASGRVPVSIVTGHQPPGSPAASGPTPRVRLQVQVDSATEKLLAPWLDPSTIGQIRADVAAAMTIEADALALDRVRGEIELQRAHVTIGSVAIAQTRPTRIAINDGRVRIVDWNWAGPGNQIAVRGGLQVEPAAEIDLTTEGRVDLALFGALWPDIGTAGRAQMLVHAHGPLTSPQVDGRVEISQAELRLTDPRLIVTGLAGTLTFAGDRLLAEGLEGTANGGTLRVSGELDYSDVRQPAGVLVLGGRGIVLDLKGLRTEFDSDLRFTKSNGRPMLSGSIVLQRGAYREPLSLAGGLLAALREQGVSADATAPSMLDEIDLNVRLTSSNDLLVDNNYAQIEMATDVRLVGTPRRPGLVGRATVREGGQIFLGGNTYRIVGDGTIDFTDTNRITPTLSISALTRVAGRDITLTVTGPPDALRTDLSSDPPLGQADLAALLLTGRTLESGGGTLAVPRDQLLGYLSGEFLGSAGRAVGLDTVRIQRGLPDVQFNAGLVATEIDPSSRLTFGKDVTPDLRLILSQSLDRTSGLTWIVSYKVRRNIEARIVSLDNGDRAYDFRHDVSFGGSTRAAERTAARTRESVMTIRFTGDAGDGAEDLLDRLKLRQGARFDFFTWQGDRERLETFFVERGYYEVQVTATRESIVQDGAPGVALEYEISPGPMTVLAVEGARLPSGVVRELQEMWTHTTSDQFLIEETTSTVKAYLANQGFLRATVSAAIEGGAAQKRLVLRIDPGSPTDRLEIRWIGNERLGTRRLDSFVEARGLSRSAWTDPGRLGTALLRLYREEGMLAASVRVQPVKFDARTAILPVDIVEGSEFQLATVAFDGVNGLPEPTVRNAFPLAAGDRFPPGRIERARQQLETRYRRSGFTEATVAVTTEVHRDTAQVDLLVSIDEGPRHVLRDVVIAGATRTHRNLVGRTLKLDVGQPVDLAEWYTARSRLYDTGVFRRVEIEEEPIADGKSSASETSEQPVRANVSVEELPSWRARYGVQISDQTAPASEMRQFALGLSGDVAYRNLFGRAMSAGAATRYDANFRTVRTFLTAPALVGRPITSNFFVSRSRQELGQASARPFVTDKVDLTAEQRFRPRGRLELAYSYKYERNHTFDRDITPGDPFAFDITVNVARLTGTIVSDSRDDLVDATRGWFHASTVEYAAAGLGSDVRFAKLALQQYYYRSLPGQIVLASAARFGLATGFGQRLIPSERFFAGGGSSVRGFEQDSLGPLDVFGSVAGGNALIVLNQEIRFPLFKWFRGVGFVDAGNAFASAGDLSLADLRPSIGIGTRIQTPVALVRIDLGVPVSRGGSKSTGRWIFSVGQAF